MLYHPNSGYYFTHYRSYDPATGRWLSRDPIGEEGGINLYSYVEGNPLSYADPLGLEKIVLFSPKDPLYSSAMRDPDVAGQLTVYGHGNEDNVADDRNGRSILDANGLSKLIDRSGLYKDGMPIRLAACETGKGKNPIGKKLADLKNAPVIAPDKYVQMGIYGIKGIVGPTYFSSPGSWIKF